MSINVLMPQMGESILEGTVTKWLKKAGDKVRRDESLFEVSTDKVDSEIPAPADGVLSAIVVREGVTVKIGDVVAIIREDPGVEAEAPAAMVTPFSEPVSQPESEKIEAQETAVKIEELPPTVAAITISPEVETRSEAVAVEVAVTRGEAEAAEITSGAPMPADGVAPATEETAPQTADDEERQKFIHASPLVRRIALDYGVALSEIPGTGLVGRITMEDLLGYLRRVGKMEPLCAPAQQSLERPAESVPKEPPPLGEPLRGVPYSTPPTPAGLQQTVGSGAPLARTQTPGLPPMEGTKFSGDTETVTMTPMRKAISEHMILSRRTSAHVQTVFEVDMTAIVQLREKHKVEFEARHGMKLTYTPFLVKALVDTVRAFPILNCSVSGDQIIYIKPVNVGIAVALDTGLIVPVVKDAHLKSFSGLALAIRDLADRARAKKLKPEEVQFGTITITNPGIYGALFGTPIIHQPQVAILDVGSLQQRPVIIHDAIAIRTMMYLVLSFDHRVIDGAVADQAMARLKARLESWGEWKE